MNALILFTKVPIANFSKTRLKKVLSPCDCSDLSLCFIKDLINKFAGVKDFDVFLFFTPSDKFHIIQDFVPKHFRSFPQAEGDIGEKMHSAMKDVFDLGYEKVALVGSDIPSLTKKIIAEAFSLLEKSDLVFGPTVDGGYYLVASNKNTFNKDIFSLSVNWSTESVLSDSIRSVKKSGSQIALTETFRDIDDADDLRWLVENLKAENENIETTKFLREKEIEL